MSINREIPHRATLLALAAVLLLGGCGKAEQAGGPPAGAAPAVTVVTVHPESLPVVTELPGRTTPYLVAELRPQVTGIVKARLFTEGGTVQAGDVLYEIDPATYQAAVDSARANLARAEANLVVARLKAGRYADLVQTQAVSQQLYDEASALEKQAAADVQSARAALDQARIDLDYTRVQAPITGRIGRSTVTAGALVTANQVAALATVQQLDPIYVDLNQSSADLLRLQHALASGHLQRGADDTVPVTLQLEDGSAYPTPGRLAFSEVTVDPTTGSVTLRAVFPNPDGVLLPGMYVRARLAQGVQDDAIRVPHAAVSRTPRGEAQVYVVNAAGTVESRVVQAGQSGGGYWTVSAGLTAGERVIIEGLQYVQPGATVQAVEAGAKPAPAPVATAASN